MQNEGESHLLSGISKHLSLECLGTNSDINLEGVPLRLQLILKLSMSTAFPTGHCLANNLNTDQEEKVHLLPLRVPPCRRGRGSGFLAPQALLCPVQNRNEP